MSSQGLTSVQLPLSRDLLRNTATQLISRVHKSNLQEALIGSKLVRKDIARDDLKRLCSNPSTWLSFVFEKLESPPTREAALRALSGLVDGSLPNLDTRVVNRMRKARVAAEQRHIEKLRREIEGLDSLRSEGALPDLPAPVPMLFLWLKGQNARNQVAAFAKQDRSDSTSQPELTSVPKKRGDAYKNNGSQKLAAAEVVAAVRSALAVSPMAGPPWDLDSILGNAEIVRPQISIPELGGVERKVNDLAALIRKIALARASSTVTIADISRLSKWLSDIRAIAGKADQLGLAIQELRRQLNQQIRAVADKYDQSAIDELNHIADEVLEAAPVDVCLDRIKALIASRDAVHQERIGRVRSVAKKIVETAKELPETETFDWSVVREEIADLRLDTLSARLDRIRKAVQEQAAHRRGVEKAFAVAEERLPLFSSPIEVEMQQRLVNAISSGNEELVRGLLPVTHRNSTDRTGQFEAASGMVMESISAGSDTVMPIYGPEWKVTWKNIPQGFRARSRFAATEQLSDPECVLTSLHAQALEHARRGSLTTAIDFILDIFSLLPAVDSGSDVWLSRAVSLLGIVGLGTAVSGYAVGRITELIAEETAADPSITPPPSLTALFHAPGFDDCIAQLFGYKELLPFVRPMGALLRDVAVKESPYLLEDLARGIGKSCLYGYSQTAVDLLLSIAESEKISSDLLATTRTTLESISEQPIRSRATRNPRIFGIPYWLQEGALAYEAAFGSRGRGCTRVVDDRAQNFVNVQLPPIVQRGEGFSYSERSGLLDIVLLVTNPPDSSKVGCYVEVLIPSLRNTWLQCDASYAVGSLAPGDKALVPLTFEVRDPLPKAFALHYEIRVRQAGFSQTGVDTGSLSISITAPKEIAIEEYPGALGLPITLDEKALELSSASVRKAFTELLRSLNAGGVAALVYGRRRRGKTSILRTISEHPQVLRRYIVHFDSKEDRPFRTFDDALRHLGNILDTAFTKAGFEITSLAEVLSIRPNWSAIQEWLESAKAAVRRPVHLLLLIDEFQKWLSDLSVDARAQLLGIIRGVYIRQGGSLKISMVLSGLTSIYEYRKASADFSNAFHNIYEIQRFDQRASEALIRSNRSIDFDRRAVELIRFLSGGNPYLINILGNEICRYLQEKGRPYCFGDDVEEVVRGQLDAAKSSPIWLFLQYLLRQGEEDYASEIPELPALTDLAWTINRRGSSRDKVAIKEIEDELRRASIPVDSGVLAKHIERAATNELLVREGDRYRFESPWLGQWLTTSNDGQPLPIESPTDPNLVLNRYRLTKAMAHHGLAEVWQAIDMQKIQGSVILKIYPSRGDITSGIVQRESENLSHIRHPAVVSCLNRGPDEQRGDVVVLEFVPGETLEQLLQNNSHHASRLVGPDGDLATQIEFVEQIAAGLAACHAVGIAHKDIKPANIIAQRSAGTWFPKIIDFGISSEIDNASATPTTGPYTPEYAAPEKFRNRPRKAPADIYSLGIIAYQLISGTSPFGDSMTAGALEKRLTGDFVPLKERRGVVSQHLSDLVGKMLAVEPTARPTADNLTGELSRAQEKRDWLVFRAEALNSKDPEEVCDKAFKALLAAPEADRNRGEYVDLADLFVKEVSGIKKALRYARQVLQPLLQLALRGRDTKSVLVAFVESVVSEVPIDDESREAKRIALRYFAEFLLDTKPSPELVPSVAVLLSNEIEPVLWDMRHDLFFIGVCYAAAELIQGRCENWCITACRKVRPLEGGLIEAQLWLRRAEALSVSGGSEYLEQKREIDRVLQSQAGRLALPDMAKVQDFKIVGEDEKGHLDVERIDNWGVRLLRLYPFVSSVKRVRKEPAKTGLTRILSTEAMSQHIRAATGVKQSRIIPALLDRSYCGTADTMLRINIVLAEDCNTAQRETAIEILAADRGLFPGGRES